jgi:hypothetical protein
MVRERRERRLNGWLTIIGDSRAPGQREISDAIVSKI